MFYAPWQARCNDFKGAPVVHLLPSQRHRLLPLLPLPNGVDQVIASAAQQQQRKWASKQDERHAP